MNEWEEAKPLDEAVPVWSERDRAYRCPLCASAISSIYFTARQHVRKCIERVAAFHRPEPPKEKP